jgi:hypothetical protein
LHKRRKLDLVVAVVANIGFNYSLVWPYNFESIVSKLNVVNLDILPALGISCFTNRFNYIDRSEWVQQFYYIIFHFSAFCCGSMSQVLVMTIGPMVVGGVLLIAYLVVDFENRIKKRKLLQQSQARNSVALELSEELRVKFDDNDIITFKEAGQLVAVVDTHTFV